MNMISGPTIPCDDDSICVEVTTDGNYHFAFEDCPTLASSGLVLRRTGPADIGIIAKKSYNSLESILTVRSDYFIPIGQKRKHICHHCGRLSSKVKIFEACEHFTFCSVSCLKREEPFLSQCGDIINALFAQQNTLLFVQLLVLKVFYTNGAYWERFRSKTIVLSNFLRLKVPFIRGGNDELIHATNQITSLILGNAACATLFDGDDRVGIIATLMSTVMFNSYQLPTLTVPGTFILVMHHVLARLNHSCTPNCVLSYGTKSQNKEATELFVTLKAVKSIQKGEELNIAYISNLALPSKTRYPLLQSSFGFECKCSRCLADSGDVPTPFCKILTEATEDLMQSISQRDNLQALEISHYKWWTAESYTSNHQIAARNSVFILKEIIQIACDLEDNSAWQVSSDTCCFLSELAKSMLICLGSEEVSDKYLDYLCNNILSADTESVRILRELVSLSRTDRVVSRCVLRLMCLRLLSKHWEIIGSKYCTGHLDYLFVLLELGPLFGPSIARESGAQLMRKATSILRKQLALALDLTNCYTSMEVIDSEKDRMHILKAKFEYILKTLDD